MVTCNHSLPFCSGSALTFMYMYVYWYTYTFSSEFSCLTTCNLVAADWGSVAVPWYTRVNIQALIHGDMVCARVWWVKTNTWFYNPWGCGTAQNRGIGIKVCGTTCTYTPSGDVAPLHGHYILYSQPVFPQEWALGTPSQWDEEGVLVLGCGGGGVDVQAPLSSSSPQRAWSLADLSWRKWLPCIRCGCSPEISQGGEKRLFHHFTERWLNP